MTQELLHIRRALISVSNKYNILELSHALSKHNIQLLASEGTAKQLLQTGLKVTTISQYTNFPEIMNGRLKTLHAKIYAAILARQKIDNKIMTEYSISPINMVIANFYPLIPSISENNSFQTDNIHSMTESIDIGGPSIVRAAAKNYQNVVVIVNHEDYVKIIDELNNNNGKISIKTRLELAAKAFQYVATYDNLIANNFKKNINNHKNKKNVQNNTDISNINFPNDITLINTNYTKKEDLRYGENPHQFAAFYIKKQNLPKNSISNTKQLQGKKLSFNNILDSDTALECVKIFKKPTCVIVKHGIPCGVASDNNILHAYKKAYQTDPTSSFGGIIAFNKPINNEIAQTIIEQQFTEVIIAPSINHDILTIFRNKKNIRILTYEISKVQRKKTILDIDLKEVNGGLLIQNKNTKIIDENHIKIVTKRQPTNQENIDAFFCWKVIKFIKSNAIIYGKNEQTIGIGTGQTSRIFSAKIAILKAQNEGFNLKNTIMASDAFLPFPDTIEIAASIGITCIIQPGGCIHDKKIIEIANSKNISMIFTHMRHFRH